jgi:hypothetical protein
MLLLTLALAVGIHQADGQAPSAGAISLSPTARTADLDMSKLKGEPARLAWSADGAQLYLQTAERKSDGSMSLRHYVLPATGGSFEAAEAEPPWATKYWAWKSTQSAPGAPAFKIQLDSQKRIVRSTSAPRGAAIAGMGGDAGAGASTGLGRSEGASVAIGEGQNAVVHSMLLNGEVIGEWVNAAIVPGLTYGWSPASLGLIAFANREGHIVIMDPKGGKQQITGSKDASLPAWTEDGTRLVYLEKSGKKKYTLRVVNVARS